MLFIIGINIFISASLKVNHFVYSLKPMAFTMGFLLPEQFDLIF